MPGLQVQSGDLYKNTGELDQLESQLKDIEKELDRIHKVAEALERRLNGFNITKSGDRQKIREVADETARLAQAQAALTAAHTEVAQKIAATKFQTQQLNNEQKANARLVNSAASSYDALSAQYTLNKLRLNQMTVAERENTAQGRALVNQTRQIYAEMSRLQELTGKYTLNVGNYSGAINRLGASLFQLGAAYVSVNGLQQLVGNIFGETKALDSLDVALKTVLGSERAAGEAKEYLADITDRLGTNLIDTSRSYLQFTIAANQAGFAQSKTNDVFESFAKVGSVLGLRTDELEGIFKAITQIMSKGTVQSEELRGQLGDRLPGAFGIFAKAIGVTTPQLSEMLKKGEVLAKDTLPKFAKELERTYGVENTNRVDTLAAAQGRFGRELTLIIAELKASNTFKEFFNTLADIFRTIRANLPLVLGLGKAVVTLTAAWLTWKVAMIATNALQKIGIATTAAQATQMGLLATAGRIATGSMTALNVALKANPVGFIASSIVTLIGLFSSIKLKSSNAALGIKDIGTESKKTESALVRLQSTFNVEIETLRRGNLSVENRKKLLNDVNAVAREYGAAQLTLKSNDEEILRVMKDVNAEFAKRIVLESATEQLKDSAAALLPLTAKELDINEAISKNLLDQAKTRNQINDIIAKGNISPANEIKLGNLRKQEAELAVSLANTQAQIEKSNADLLKKIKAAEKLGLNVVDIINGGGDEGPSPAGKPDKTLLDQFERLEELNKLREEGREKDLESERLKYLRSRQLFIKNGLELEGLNDFYLQRQKDINLKYDKQETEQSLKAEEARFAASGKTAAEIANYKRKLEVETLNYILALNEQYNGTLTDSQIAETQSRISLLKQEIDRGNLDITLESLRNQHELGALRLQAAGVTDAELERQRIEAEIETNQRILDLDKSLTTDQRAIYEAHIDYLKRKRSQSDVEIGLESLQREQDLEESRFNLVKRTAAEKEALAIKFEIQRIEKILALDKNLSAQQIEIFRNQISTLQGELAVVEKSEPIDFFSLFGITGLGDDEKAAISEAFSFATDQLQGYFDLQTQLTQAALQEANSLVDEKRRALSVELDLLRQGYANRAGYAQRELNEAKRRQDQALKDAKRAQIAQLEINTVLEASNLTLAVAKVLSTIPPPFNVIAAVGMLGTFAIAKVKAFQLARKKEFKHGGFEEIGGGTHASGNDTYLGSNAGADLYAERRESVGIFNAAATSKYKGPIRNFVNAANRLELDALINRNERAGQGIPFVSNNINLNQERVEAELVTIRKELQKRNYQDTQGRLVEEEPGRKTTWVS